jgi:hypothetical protein
MNVLGLPLFLSLYFSLEAEKGGQAARATLG